MTASTVEPSATPNGLSADTAPVGPELAAGWPPPAAHEASPPATGVSAAAVSAMRRNWRRRRGREVSISCLSSEVGCRPQGGPRRGWHGPASRVPPPRLLLADHRSAARRPREQRPGLGAGSAAHRGTVEHEVQRPSVEVPGARRYERSARNPSRPAGVSLLKHRCTLFSV